MVSVDRGRCPESYMGIFPFGEPFESYEYMWFLAGMFMGCISIGTILEFLSINDRRI